MLLIFICVDDPCAISLDSQYITE